MNIRRKKRKRIENQKYPTSEWKNYFTYNNKVPQPTTQNFPLLLLFSCPSSTLFTFSPLTFSLLSKNSPTSHTNNPLQPNFLPPKNHHLPPPLPEILLHRNNTKSKVSKWVSKCAKKNSRLLVYHQTFFWFSLSPPSPPNTHTRQAGKVGIMMKSFFTYNWQILRNPFFSQLFISSTCIFIYPL